VEAFGLPTAPTCIATWAGVTNPAVAFYCSLEIMEISTPYDLAIAANVSPAARRVCLSDQGGGLSGVRPGPPITESRRLAVRIQDSPHPHLSTRLIPSKLSAHAAELGLFNGLSGLGVTAGETLPTIHNPPLGRLIVLPSALINHRENVSSAVWKLSDYRRAESRQAPRRG
jgi:hypothetical protein